MDINTTTNESMWKIATGALPVLVAMAKGLKIFIEWLEYGTMHKLKHMDKNFSEYFKDEEKALLKKRIREVARFRLTGYKDPVLQKRLIYVWSRANMNLPGLWAIHIGRYLVLDGKRFYFDFTSTAFIKKRRLFRILGLIYLAYAIIPWVIFFNEDAAVFPLWATATITFLIAFISIMFFISFPSDKQTRNMNGQLLKVDLKEYGKQ
ncbi:hypothetical protein [Cronobacter sakazakii]|uniref:hypothetical protein n=1 Tax=Cronobacter sakazakii TaxID=28141 RepID=UPI0022B3B169|nr:hypothetical protein [Cronobacter sakazakii]MCZ6151139.1 hypothetical protein [Cronobacter sakazakii]